MILYKYVSMQDAEKILTNNSIAFSQPKYFNDPFDLPAYPYSSSNPKDEIGQQAEAAHLSRISEWAKNWAELTGILCLTRTPTNPLMWAHYAQSHFGMVIGIDAVLACLTDPDRNLVPAQYGSVIYVSGRSQQPFITFPKSVITIGETHRFPPDYYERLQRLFLQKPLCWAYEEEVRVLKSLGGISPENQKNESGTFRVINTSDGRPIYLYSFSPGSIREIYFGYRMKKEDKTRLLTKMSARHEFKAFNCDVVPTDFSVRTTDYSPHVEGSQETEDREDE